MEFPKAVKRFQNALALRSLVILQWMIVHIPYFIVIWIVNTLLAIAYVFIFKLKKDVRHNFRTAFNGKKDEKDLELMTKGCLKNVGRSMIDMLHYSYRPDKIEKNVAIEGRSYLEGSLSLGKGVIAVTAHLGNFAIMFMKLTQLGYKVNVIIRPMRDKNFEKFMFLQTDRWGINMIRTSPRKEFLQETVRALKHNELLFILLDEDSRDKNSIVVDFLNKKSLIATGPMLFHDRIGSPIHTIFTIKDPQGRYRICISPEFKTATADIPEKNMVQNISQLMKKVEAAILEYPVQWGGWLSKGWRQPKVVV